MKEYLEKVIEQVDLTQDEMAAAFDLIMTGEASPPNIAAFLVALRMKGETIDEIAGAVKTMRKHSLKVDVSDLPVVDTCGTGGDAAGTFNISTTSAFIVAGTGIPVAKHGNRAISSKCGSADVLAELGVNIDLPPDAVAESIRQVGLGFLFAPNLHPAMKHAGPIRRELRIRTIFNILGPMTNPAGAKRQVIGIFAPELAQKMAEVLRVLGSERAMVVHGLDGLDEITTTTKTRISELKDGEVSVYDVDPMQYIESYSTPADLAGGDPAFNAKITRNVLSGESGPAREISVLNAAAAIFAGGKSENLSGGVSLAREALDSGRALDVLDNLIEFSQKNA